MLQIDAEKALEMLIEACRLITGPIDTRRDKDVHMLSPEKYMTIARLYSEIGEFDLGIERATHSIKHFKERSELSPDEAFQILGCIYLNKFYGPKRNEQDTFDGSGILELAKKCQERASETAPSSKKNYILISAQIHYFLHDTDRAYNFLAVFLDLSFTQDSFSCGCCQQKSGDDVVTKRCSGCKTTCYCSSRCQ